MDGVYGYGGVGLVDLGRGEVAGCAVGVALDTFIVVEQIWLLLVWQSWQLGTRQSVMQFRLSNV